jgi:hypothetical protein
MSRRLTLIVTAWVLLCILLVLAGCRDQAPSFCQQCPAYWTQQDGGP